VGEDEVAKCEFHKYSTSAFTCATKNDLKVILMYLDGTHIGSTELLVDGGPAPGVTVTQIEWWTSIYLTFNYIGGSMYVVLNSDLTLAC